MSLDVDPREVVTEPRRSPSQKNWRYAVAPSALFCTEKGVINKPGRQAAWTEQMMRAVTSRFDSAMTYAPAVLAARYDDSPQGGERERARERKANEGNREEKSFGPCCFGRCWLTCS